ncbi:polysaccharide pyruvyl transferase family protein [Carboxylicivirga marina]|uniref:polysaccharide pyruvyl transferase family protein n=1 Tax=Carboxylicivirga marina TaxID=2800988 RepID=UPI0025976C6A|nr:polysaccharide pyruvyl transferase family protein [uncultured Carboxylicivirga sp.]
MAPVFFKDNKGNFGDEINKIIFKELPSALNKRVIGIGTILGSEISNNKKLIVFGSGVRNPLDIKLENLDVRFVRGPLSSSVCNGAKFISDPAYLLNIFLKNIDQSHKKYNLSLIPHYSTINNAFWLTICRLLKINFIDPTQPVKEVVQEIVYSKKTICGAMHAAIISDLYNTPWIRLRMNLSMSETPFISEFKWLDWLGSIDRTNFYINIGLESKRISGFKGLLYKSLTSLEILTRLISQKKSNNYQLSNEQKKRKIIKRLIKEYEKLKREK